MQRKIKYHLGRRHEIFENLEFCWERGVEEVLYQAKKADEIKAIVKKAESHPLHRYARVTRQHVKAFLEVLYQLELNSFTATKLRALGHREESVERIQQRLEEMVGRHKMYHVYLECMEIFDKVSHILKTTNQAEKKAMASGFHRKSVVRFRDSKEARALLLLKNIFEPIYNKYREFRLSINADQFRPIVGAFMFLYEKTLETLDAATGLGTE